MERGEAQWGHAPLSRMLVQHAALSGQAMTKVRSRLGLASHGDAENLAHR